ncbi:MAG: alpha-N-acetylglucosaminidase C-terminal domain-containing protein [Holophagales bacterium]|nr:alpha-N-acetylglucosaminidase C-terminal domain-containing protein [Holophagales bacterium]
MSYKQMLRFALATVFFGHLCAFAAHLSPTGELAAPKKIGRLSAVGKCAPEHAASLAVDGDPSTYWESPAYTSMQDHSRHLDIHLDGLYDLSSVKLILPPGAYYHYQVYASANGETFAKVAYKSDGRAAAKEGESHSLSGQPGARRVSVVRINVSFASSGMAGRIAEVELYGEKISSSAPKKLAVTVPDFEGTPWAKEYRRFALDSGYARQKTITEMVGLVGRVLGDKWKGNFSFEVADVAANGKDAFEIEAADGRVAIRGHNGVSLASGLNFYLKNYARVNYNPLFVSNLNMPTELPATGGKVLRQTNYDVRYALNFCTYSYTMAFWGWSEYEAYLDWAAMNGINLMLDIVGQEEVQRRLLLKYGYTENEIRDYICGPAYFAWFYMQNMTGFGGPLPDNWFAQRVELGRRMHDRMQAYGISPVLQGFSGMVPTDFKDKNPGASTIAQGDWCGFVRPDMLRTLETGDKDWFPRMAADFYKAQSDVFGPAARHYAVDPFHEGGKMGGMDAGDTYRRIQDAMVKANGDAIWVIQQWSSLNAAKLGKLDKDHAIVLDLFSEMRPQNDVMEQTGTKWVWNMLHSFGGRMGLFGDLPILAQGPPTDYAQKKHMIGIGTTMEAYSNSGVVYDLISDMTWNAEPISPSEYIRNHVNSRYGSPDSDAVAGWDILANTAFAKKTAVVEGPPESIINARPTAAFKSASTWGHSKYMYDKLEMEKALPHFIRAYDALGGNPAFVHDFVEVAVQVLSTAALEHYSKMIAAYQKKDADGFKLYSGKFMDAAELMERLLSISPNFGVGKWINGARVMLPDMDDWTRDLFEFNARALITTWGGQKNQVLKDYSNRQWSGLTGDLYLARWKKFIEAHSKALASGEPPTNVNYFSMEWEWANRKSDEGKTYPLTGSGENLKALAQRIYDEFSLTKMNAGLPN